MNVDGCWWECSELHALTLPCPLVTPQCGWDPAETGRDKVIVSGLATVCENVGGVDEMQKRVTRYNEANNLLGAEAIVYRPRSFSLILPAGIVKKVRGWRLGWGWKGRMGACGGLVEGRAGALSSCAPLTPPTHTHTPRAVFRRLHRAYLRAHAEAVDRCGGDAQGALPVAGCG